MEVPKDSHNFVFVSVYFMGLAFIMPWQILVVMSGYWDQTFNKSDHKGFASYLTVASTIPYAISITLHALIGQKFSIRSRVYCSQVLHQILYQGQETFLFSDRHGFYIGFHNRPLQIGH